MIEKGGNFFEQHIEKMVLAIVGVVCLWLLVTRVLISPNKVLYNGKKFAASEIDNHISEQAKNLEFRLKHKPKAREPYKSRVNGFVALIDGKIADGNSLYAERYPLIAVQYPLCAKYAIGNIDTGIGLPKPPLLSRSVSDDRKYFIPQIGEVNDVSVEHIRAVAYVPIAAIDEQNPYDSTNSQPGDVDFVTVEGKFDVASLYRNFQESFAGEDVLEEWRDPCLANPVFAGVQLQRQELLADGRWSDWQIVPRTKIDPYKGKFEIIENVKDLPPGGIKVRLLQFDEKQVRADMLQPEAYVIASAEEEWFPPSLHKQYVEYQRKIEVREKRKALESEKKGREQGRERTLRGPGRYGEQEPGRYGERRSSRYGERDSGRYGERSSGRYGERSSGRYGERRSGRYGERSGRDRESRTRSRRGSSGYDRRQTRRGERDEYVRGEERLGTRDRDASETTLSDLYDELKKILITKETDISKMREPLAFWAHDDTVEPGKSYRYRIRLGVFNPIAGTEQVSESDKHFCDNVILWSDFSDVTEIVEIPGMLYFFPRDVQEAAKIVTVKVCRYVLGYWYSKSFAVKQGEVIGKVVEYEGEEGKAGEKEEDVVLPETIDYGTGAVLVDVRRVNDWLAGGGRELRARVYSDMLYSFDGDSIEHIPIELSYWPTEMQNKFREIERYEKKPKKALRPWVSGLGRRGPGRRIDREGFEEFDEAIETDRRGRFGE